MKASIACFASIFVLGAAVATATSPAPLRVPSQLAVRGALGAPPAGIVDVKFADLYKMPIGPAGLQASDKLLGLAGRRVRVVGYMVEQAQAQAGQFLLTPVLVDIGDGDEGLADDVPPTAIAVHVPNATVLPHLPGLIQVTGTLTLGNAEDATGRVIGVHLALDAAPARALRNLARGLPARPKHATP